MKTKLAMVALLMVAQPAQACHHYSRWYYPYPQSCSTSNNKKIKLFKPIKIASSPKPIDKPPPSSPYTKDEQDKLKRVLELGNISNFPLNGDDMMLSRARSIPAIPPIAPACWQLSSAPVPWEKCHQINNLGEKK